MENWADKLAFAQSAAGSYIRQFHFFYNAKPYFGFGELWQDMV